MQNFESIKQGGYRPEKPDEKLVRLLREISDRQNEELGAVSGNHFLNSDCAININFFDYSDIEDDKIKAYEKDIEWSGANDPNVRDFYIKTYGLEEGEGIVRKIVEQYKINKERNANGRL
jgi:hypothetical protein